MAHFIFACKGLFPAYVRARANLIYDPPPLSLSLSLSLSCYFLSPSFCVRRYVRDCATGCVLHQCRCCSEYRTRDLTYNASHLVSIEHGPHLQCEPSSEYRTRDLTYNASHLVSTEHGTSLTMRAISVCINRFAALVPPMT